MNEFEKLEAELRELVPDPPGDEFTSRIENALGDAGNVAMRCMPNQEERKDNFVHARQPDSLIRFPRLLAFSGLAGLGLAAVWAVIFYLSSSIAPEGKTEENPVDIPVFAQSNVPDSLLVVEEDPDSPLHGLSLDQLEDVSAMPVSGWLDPQINERFLRVVDEGIFERPSGLPARRVRQYFMDETLWSHPASDTRILSTTPREEVLIIELDTY